MGLNNVAVAFSPQRFHLRQERAALLSTGVLTSALVLVPILVLGRMSFAPPGTIPFTSSLFTLENYKTIFLDPVTYRLLGNTLVYAVGSVLEALVIAFALAWTTERSDIGWSSMIRTGMFISLALPPLAVTFGWILLLNPGNGALNVLIRNLTGMREGPFD